MYKVLRDCFESFERTSTSTLAKISSNSSQNQNFELTKPTPIHTTLITEQGINATINSKDFLSVNYMTLAEASKQHTLVDKHDKIVGDIKKAYECFEVYADLSKTYTANCIQTIAKYYKAYYISRGLVESPPSKDKIVAELFKEVADDETNMIFSEAGLRIGYCLYKGKGVDQNYSEALIYFEKAAEDGNRVAMYNTGKMYYEGIGIEKNEEKAIHYMKLGNYHEDEPAINFCKEHNLY
jgi:hypothetical protein